MPKQVIITIGLPASGKSTWAKELVKNEPGQWKRINKDDLRSMLDASDFSGKNEKFVLKIRNDLILKSLDEGYNVIVDDTNIHQKHESAIRALVGNRAEISTKIFTTPLQECIRRDAERDAPVGAKIIRMMYGQLKARFGDILDKESSFRVKVKDFSQNPAFNKNCDLPDAIICDLDGTLALLNDRGPYDTEKCETDLLNIPVAEVLITFASMGTKIILCSGRDDDFRSHTERFLEKYDVPHDLLLMRASGDRRNDALIKKEIYDAEIRDKYNVIFVLDDRDKVVRMWREELHLTCFQVEYGSF
jgi:predicted kinase